MATLPWRAELAGRLEEHWIDSELLKDNPLGDPHRRPVLVYTPPGYDKDPGRRYPSVYVMQGWGSHVGVWASRTPFRQPFTETADEVFARGDAPPAIVVYIDAWTSLGGSQYVDSPATGPYHSYLCNEIVPWVDRHFRTLDHADHRAVMGKSSGGFGALVTPMLRPDLFGALASHAGDALFEYTFMSEFPGNVRFLREYDGDVWRWWKDFNSRTAFTKAGDELMAVILCGAACWSAEPDGSYRLPFDTRTGAVDYDLWDRWLAWDPVRMAAEHADALRGLRGIWIDAGNRDQYSLDLGAEAFRAELDRLEVPAGNVHCELFDATHTAVEYRYPLSLAWMCERIAA